MWQQNDLTAEIVTEIPLYGLSACYKWRYIKTDLDQRIAISISISPARLKPLKSRYPLSMLSGGVGKGLVAEVLLCKLMVFFTYENTILPVYPLSSILQNDRQLILRTEEYSESPFVHRKRLNRNTNGTIRKCSSRAFQWMVMSVGFGNL
jgi:hypothetical protein